jgi:hypothetical protein
MTVTGELIARLFRVTLDRDGQAPGIEEAAREGAKAATPEQQSRAGASRIGRRRLPRPEAILLESAGQKILHAWLQNRHQTLFPLTVNLRRLSSHEVELLMRVAAIALSAAGPVTSARSAQVADRLGSIGANEDQLRLFAEAANDPPPLARVLEQAEQQNLTAYAYASSLIALDQRELVDQLFLEYLAARLALPASVVRSVNRRYRR